MLIPEKQTGAPSERLAKRPEGQGAGYGQHAHGDTMRTTYPMKRQDVPRETFVILSLHAIKRIGVKNG